MYLLFTLWALVVCLTLVGTFVALFRVLSSRVLLKKYPPVSILKPLKGIDSDLKNNLESFFNLSYPEFEILFSVESPTDPACPIVQELMEKYSHIKAKFITESMNLGPNPKVNNLVTSYGEARFDVILISDSNISVPQEYLLDLVPHLGKNVGVVTGAVAGINAEGMGGRLEALYLNTFFLRWMHLLSLIGKTCVIGKSMLFRREVANRFGGIRVLSRYLAEDYMAGEAMRYLGLQVQLSPKPVLQHIGQYRFKDFWSRHVRWGRIRKSQALFAFLIEPITSSVLCGVLGAIAFNGIWGVPIETFLIWHFGVWIFQDMMLSGLVLQPLRVEYLLAWIVREFLQLPLWFHGAVGNVVSWRGKKLKVRQGGLLAE